MSGCQSDGQRDLRLLSTNAYSPPRGVCQTPTTTRSRAGVLARTTLRSLSVTKAPPRVPPIGADFRKNGGEERTTSLFYEKVRVSNQLSQEKRCQYQLMIAKCKQ